MTQDSALLFLFVEQELTFVNINNVIYEFKNVMSMERRLVLKLIS